MISYKANVLLALLVGALALPATASAATSSFKASDGAYDAVSGTTKATVSATATTAKLSASTSQVKPSIGAGEFETYQWIKYSCRKGKETYSKTKTAGNKSVAIMGPTTIKFKGMSATCKTGYRLTAASAGIKVKLDMGSMHHSSYSRFVVR